METIHYLSQFNLLQSLALEDLMEMEELTRITVVPKNTYIQTPPTFSEGLFFVKKGKVRLYRLNADGKQFTSDILSEGNVFGEMNVISFGTKDHYIEAMEECHICTIDPVRFEEFVATRPRFLMSLMQVLSDRIKSMSQLTHNLAIGNLHDKILCVLLKLSDQLGVKSEDNYYKINVPLSHQEIANLIGASREAVTMALQELVKAEVLQTGFRTILIHHDKVSGRNL
ncbi:cAMP-binding protein [Paenibacillus sp. VTT E-133280]|uniref:Crp/Fnr family transcriptional regulator n=1 Tax=unclassified Paenibacillus TaxID=185978 RepID=UPI000B9FDAB7|nr:MULTISPECIES: Crp/Fnr family transcriptional regulator [unclassified Paenibacillus]MDH6371925.1 CRP/FNR family cyclic AMP-dependent transcriptional regulator [Paenibacillus sp. PastF-3]OZQ69520.1 cAMP-binding protein [Paenibacillus sp. VTT E-133280]